MLYCLKITSLFRMTLQKQLHFFLLRWGRHSIWVSALYELCCPHAHLRKSNVSWRLRSFSFEYSTFLMFLFSLMIWLCQKKLKASEYTQVTVSFNGKRKKCKHHDCWCIFPFYKILFGFSLCYLLIKIMLGSNTFQEFLEIVFQWGDESRVLLVLHWA